MANTTAYGSQTNHILILGDSLSAGYGIELESSWPTLLQNQLAEQDFDVHVHNVSISGQTTAEGLAQLSDLMISTQATFVVLELGANDGLRGLSISSMKQNLASMIQIAQAHGAKVLLLGMRVPSNYGRRYTQMFHNSFIQLADEYDIGFVPFMLQPLVDEQGEVDRSLLLADGLHLTAAAQPLILQHLWPDIEQLMNSSVD